MGIGILSRIAQAVGVMLAVALVAFVLFQYVGDPIGNMVGQETSFADREALREQLGLNDPAPVQFFRFVGHALQGDFGISYRMQRPVSDLIAERLPATIELVFVSAIFAILTGVGFGILTGLKSETWYARFILTISLVGVSLPTFVIGIALIYLFAVTLNWLPSFGRGDVRDLGFWTTGLLSAEGWRAILLPAVTLGLYQMTLILRLVRAELLEVLQTDYIKFAHARGLPARTVHFRHALKSTLLPVVTIIGLQIGTLLVFSIITETVFQWPGMGLLFIQAVQFADVPVMSAYLVLAGLVFVSVNLAVDLIYMVIDPRLREVSSGAAGS